MGEKWSEGYVAHPADTARFEDAEELDFDAYTHSTASHGHYVISPTVSRTAPANVFAEFMSPLVQSVVLAELVAKGLLEKLLPENV